MSDWQITWKQHCIASQQKRNSHTLSERPVPLVDSTADLTYVEQREDKETTVATHGF